MAPLFYNLNGRGVGKESGWLYVLVGAVIKQLDGIQKQVLSPLSDTNKASRGQKHKLGESLMSDIRGQLKDNCMLPDDDHPRL